MFHPAVKDKANNVEYHLNSIEAEVNKQRRKVQNRKNQRSHREFSLTQFGLS
jgi:hypothetical protein